MLNTPKVCKVLKCFGSMKHFKRDSQKKYLEGCSRLSLVIQREQLLGQNESSRITQEKSIKGLTRQVDVCWVLATWFEADEYEPVFAEIVVVRHSRRRMSCRPVGHAGHARDPGAGGVGAAPMLFFFFCSLRRQRQSCAQLHRWSTNGRRW